MRSLTRVRHQAIPMAITARAAVIAHSSRALSPTDWNQGMAIRRLVTTNSPRGVAGSAMVGRGRITT